MPSLNELALKYGTDKSSEDHGYTAQYETLFGPLRYAWLNIVELGVWKGDSLRMWREYFPNATITGVDRVDRNIKIDNTKVVVCEQDSDELPGLLAGPLDIIIDDASHLPGQTIRSFHNLFPLLRAGGMYVIEDLQTSYQTAYEGDPNPNANTRTAIQFCKSLVDQLHRGEFPSEYTHPNADSLASVFFWPNMCVITKP